MNLEEIRAWNKRLKDAFPGISFQEDIHKYTIAGQEDRPIKSVSALMKYFYEEFDSDTLAEKYAKSRKLDPEDVKLAWTGEGTISTTHGTKVHLFGEDYIKWKWLGELDEPPVVFDKQSLGVKQFLDSLPSYFVPVASELQMYHPEHWYCGTADIIFYNEKTGKLSIGDFKSNRVIEGDKYSEKPLKYIGEKYGLDSSNLSKYSVQFSFYQLMLENKGFEFDTRVLIHLTDDKFEKKLYKTYRTLDLTEDLDKWLLTKEHLK